MQIASSGETTQGKGRLGFHFASDHKGHEHTVGDVLDGTPARAAGVVSGSYLVRVNGTDLRGMSHDEAVRMLSTAPLPLDLTFDMPEGVRRLVVPMEPAGTGDGGGVGPLGMHFESDAHTCTLSSTYFPMPRSRGCASGRLSPACQWSGSARFVARKAAQVLADAVPPLVLEVASAQRHNRRVSFR